MSRRNAVALALALATAVLGTTAAGAAAPPSDEIQAPHGEDRIEAPRR